MHPSKDDRIYYKEVLSLAAQGMAIFLVAPDDGDRSRFAAGVTFFPLKKRSGYFGRILTLVETVRVAAKLRPDICHFHDLDFVFVIPWMKLCTGAALVYDSHEAYPESLMASPSIPQPLRKIASWLIGKIEKISARLCAVVVTADNPTAEAFMKSRIPALPVFNYPPLHIFQPMPELETRLSETYKGRKIIVYQGTMGESRGLFHMIRAMDKIRKTDPSILLLLIGLDQEKLLQETERRVELLDLRSFVDIIPWVDHRRICAYMRIAKVGLVPWQPVPKNLKNIPIKVFEYMACGLPVLGSDLPPIAEYVNPSGAGLLFPADDVDAMAEGVLALLSDETQWIAMRSRGLEAVRKKWNWALMERKLHLLYDRLASIDRLGPITMDEIKNISS